MKEEIKLGKCRCDEPTYNSVCYTCKCVTLRHAAVLREALPEAYITINNPHHSKTE